MMEDRREVKNEKGNEIKSGRKIKNEMKKK